MSASARDTIFRAIEGSAVSETIDDEAIEQQAQALLVDPDSMRPPRTKGDVVEAFMDRINGEKVAATARRIDSLERLPEIVKSMLTDRALPREATLQPTEALTSLGWADAGINLASDLDDGVAIGLALWGVAETGSLVVHSAADSPILLHFLPAISIVAVPASRLLWHLEDYSAAARDAGDAAPRNACLITGASGTTDIEGRLVTGAHGPGELQVVVFDQ